MTHFSIQSPVMGLSFMVNTQIKVAKFGISSQQKYALQIA